MRILAGRVFKSVVRPSKGMQYESGYDNGHGLILEGKGIPDEGMGLDHVLMKVGDGRDDVLPELDLRRKVKIEVNQARTALTK